MKQLVALLVVVWTLLWSPGALAQLLDAIDVRRESADAVVRVQMTRPVRVQRSVHARDSELTIVQYEVVGQGELPAHEPTSSLQLKGQSELPAVAISDESAGTLRAADRKMVIRLVPAARVRARSGRDGRSIELVMVGLGDKVAPSLPLTVSPQVTGRSGYRIVLQSSADATMQLDAVVPKSMQAYDLDTGKRRVDGVDRYEIYLGPFATRGEAEAALPQLRARFPQAALLEASASATPAPGLSAPGATPSVTASAVAAPAAAPSGAVDVDRQAAQWLAAAREAQARGDLGGAIETLGRLLDLPPNGSSRDAQMLMGELWAVRGDTERSRREFELFLKLYPKDPEAGRIGARLAALPVASKAAAPSTRTTPSTTNFNGSIGLYYYGGQSKVRSEEFKDSGLGGLPELVQNPTLSGVDQKMVMTSVDLNYRHRDAETDLRAVFRDSFQDNLMPGRPSRNRLSAAYVDYRLLARGLGVRLGRQSPLGAGVMNRFDGAHATWTIQPKWKWNVTAGVPTDKLQQTRRHFYGTSVDADALTDNLGASVYVNEQKIDGEVDRRGVGVDTRYFKEGVFVSTNLDYDLKLRAINIAAIQGTWQQIDAEGQVGTTVNVMVDRRAQPLLTLGNALFFQDPNGVIVPVRLSDALALRDLETLRSHVRSTTAYSTQGMIGVTTPVSRRWQVGADLRLTKIDAIPPVADILPQGQPATGNIWGAGGQVIGTNLYSDRDTHVFSASLQRAPTFNGVLLMYNNVSAAFAGWQLEPSIQFYRQTSSDGLKLNRWKPGLRVSRRLVPELVVESSLDYEVTHISGPQRSENTDRIFYYLGGRYEF